MKKLSIAFLALVLVLSFSLVTAVPAAAATTWSVDAGGGGDFTTIQAAIDAASADDTINVAPGTYVENIDFKGKAVTVKSTSGPGVTIIDGGNSGTVVTFNTGEGPSSVIEGFTITNGNATNSDWGGSAGGGILCDGASPIIRNNIITNNYAENTHSGGDWEGGGTAGGGIACNHGACPAIEGNTITENHGYNHQSWGASGGGISVAHHSKPVIRNNIITYNLGDDDATAGGVLCIYDGSAMIEGNTITNNEATSLRSKWSGAGGGITCYKNSHPYITNNLIAYNTAVETAGGQAAGGIFDRWDSYPTIESNTIAFNDVEGGSKKAGGIWDSWWRISVHNSIVWGNTGGADIEIGGQIAEPWRPFPPGYVPGVTYCDFASGYYRIHHIPVPITNGMDSYTIGNINANPLFDDFHLTWDNYPIPDSTKSPCIDAGTNVSAPATDLEGRERPWDGDGDGVAVTDMGCYEFGAPLPNFPPVVSAVYADPNELWPPNHKPVAVTITVDATDPNGRDDIVRITYSVTDEYGIYDVAETDLPEEGVISLIAERDGKDKDGRVYTVMVTVYDTGNLSDSGSVEVVVPHDQGKKP